MKSLITLCLVGLMFSASAQQPSGRDLVIVNLFQRIQSLERKVDSLINVPTKIVMSTGTVNWKPINTSPQPKDSLICAERGHILEGYGTTTLAYCPPYTIDSKDSTVTVYPACNTTTTMCRRCKQSIISGEKEYRVTTWRRKPKQ